LRFAQFRYDKPLGTPLDVAPVIGEYRRMKIDWDEAKQLRDAEDAP